MLDNQIIAKISDLIREKKPTVVMSHLNPDGDAIGSAIALSLFLDKLGVPSNVIIPNEVPDFLKWLPGYERVHSGTQEFEKCTKLIKEASTLFLLDFNEPGRAGNLMDIVQDSPAFKILIDHHEDPEDFVDILISEPWRGSAGEMVYKFMEELGEIKLLDRDIATCLYVAIMTDTGNFRYGSSYSEIFTIAGELVEAGIDKDEIFTSVYDSYSEDRMKLLGYSMSEKLVVIPGCNTAYISLTMEELDRFNHQVGDTEGFVNVPFSIKGIRVTALFIEKKNHVKISLRSKGDFSVDAIARQHFNGGGHVNAAGGESADSLEDTAQHFIRVIKQHRNELV